MKLPARTEYLDKLLGFVRSYAVKEGFSQKRTSNIELATEEALANICHHAYTGEIGEMEIICSTDNRKRLIVNIIDTGKPFNILTVSKPDLTSDILQRELGGLGVLLIRKMVNEVYYIRKGDRNILTLILDREITQNNNI